MRHTAPLYPARMPIVDFQNYRTAPLRLVIEPAGLEYEVAHLGTAGVRYSLAEGEEDRSTSVVGDDRIEFWCNAAKVEVDVVAALPVTKLLWHICVDLGFCGGLVDGEPTYVADLIPASGLISAESFANLAIRADGSDPSRDDAKTRGWREKLEAKFIEHLGSPVVPVETLKRSERRPFDASEPS